MKTLFMAEMGHEIRTPLNSMLAIADALKNTALSDRQSEMLDDLRLAGEQLDSLLSNMLDMARLEAGEVSIDLEAIDPVALVQAVVAEHRPEAEKAGLRLSVDAPPDSARAVIGSERRIRQVVENLISNALKFTVSGGVSVAISISRGQADALLTVTVTDSGPGIPDDRKALIFKQFQRKGTRSGAGAGLGLPIAATICDLHGGSLGVVDAPGGGAQFVATFGVEMPDGGRAVPALSGGEPPTLPENMSLLVAEDVLLNRRSLRHSLYGSSVVPTFATNGEQALKQMTGRRFDAALIDIRMPVMSGVELVRAYRVVEKREGHAPMPILACSASVPGETIEGYAGAGFDGFLTKPFTFAQLVAALVKAGVKPV